MRELAAEKETYNSFKRQIRQQAASINSPVCLTRPVG